MVVKQVGDSDSKYFSTAFIILGVLVFACFYAIITLSAYQYYALGITSPQGEALANQTEQNIEQQRLRLTFFSIFVNNISASFYLVTPFISLVFFLIVLFNTGQVIGLLAAATGIPPFTYILRISIPVAFLEILAYTILASESAYLGALAITRSGAKERLKHQSWKSWTLYLVLLLIAAIVEAYLINGKIS